VEFNDARRAVRIEDLAWNSGAGRLTFRVRAPLAVAGLTVLLPARFQGRPARNQKSVSLESRDQVALVLNLRANDDVPVSVEYQ
jgi:hypothetical protein